MTDLPTSGATVTYTLRAVLPTLNHARLAEARASRALDKDTTHWCGDAHGSKCGYCADCLAEKNASEEE